MIEFNSLSCTCRHQHDFVTLPQRITYNDVILQNVQTISPYGRWEGDCKLISHAFDVLYCKKLFLESESVRFESYIRRCLQSIISTHTDVVLDIVGTFY